MAQRRGDEPPAPGTPEYRWLYGDDTSSASAGPDATQYLRPPAAGRSAHAPDAPAAPAPAAGAGAGAGGRRSQRHESTTAPMSPPVPPTRDEPTPSSERPRRRTPVWRIVKVVLLLWLVFLVATPFFAWSKVQKVGAVTSKGAQSATTYLVVGSDSRGNLTPEEQKELGTGGDDVGQRTDTIMLLHTGKGRNVLMSIPRDSRVEVPGHGVSKINAAYAWGGAPLLVETVEKNTGLEVDHYVEIGFGGLVKMVDALDGIEICPAKPMKDKQANLDIEAGCQEADGRTALGYARSRKTYKALGDVDRARAQREVVSAIGAKALSPRTVLDPFRYWGLSGATASSFTVSEGTSPFAFAKFGLAMTRVDGEKGLTCGVPLKDLSVRWDDARASEMFGHLKADDADGIPAGLCTASGFPDQKKG